MAECGITGKKAKTLKDSQFKHVAAIIFIITLVSASLLPFLWDVEAEPTIPDSSTGIFTATWTFDNSTFFNTTETTIDDSKVFLQYHNYEWDQTSTIKIMEGPMNNVTLSDGEVELESEDIRIGSSTTTDIPQ